MRWVMAAVSAVIALVVGSVAGGLIASPLRNQDLMDTASAFVGPLAFVYIGAAMAPLRLRGASIFASIIVVLAVLTVAIRLIDPATGTSEAQSISVPIAQVAGAVLALFLVRSRRSAIARDMGWTNKQADSMTTAFDQGGRSAAVAKATEIQAEQVAALKAAGIDLTDLVPEVGKLIGWDQIIRHVFRVLSFDRHGTVVTPGDQVQAVSPAEPYGYLRAESPILNQPLSLPIVHRDDFVLATTVYDDVSLAAAVGADYELLVTYAPRRVASGGLNGTPDHCLHYVIAPRGTLEKYYSFRDDLHMGKPAPEKLFGEFVYQGRIAVGRNLNPSFE